MRKDYERESRAVCFEKNYKSPKEGLVSFYGTATQAEFDNFRKRNEAEAPKHIRILYVNRTFCQC